MSDQSEALWLAEVLMSRASMTTAQRAQAAIELRRQHAEIERLRKALKQYGRHLDDCELTLGGYQCTCAFNKQEVPRWPR